MNRWMSSYLSHFTLNTYKYIWKIFTAVNGDEGVILVILKSHFKNKNNNLTLLSILFV